MQKGTWILALNIQVCAFSARHLVVCGSVLQLLNGLLTCTHLLTDEVWDKQ